MYFMTHCFYLYYISIFFFSLDCFFIPSCIFAQQEQYEDQDKNKPLLSCRILVRNILNLKMGFPDFKEI